MSYQDGWAAINLEMPPRVPHNTPVDNVMYYVEVYEELSKR